MCASTQPALPHIDRGESGRVVDESGGAERRFKEKQHVRDRRSGVTAGYADRLPASLFMKANLLHLATTRWPADLASFNRLTAGHKSAAHSSHL